MAGGREDEGNGFQHPERCEKSLLSLAENCGTPSGCNRMRAVTGGLRFRFDLRLLSWQPCGLQLAVLARKLRFSQTTKSIFSRSKTSLIGFATP
jgi:hypothetical protein